MAKRLLPHHPLDKKFRALEAFLLDNELEIEETAMGLVVRDAATGIVAYLREENEDHGVACVPHQFETQLIMYEGGN